jgi:hypothetical protein
MKNKKTNIKIIVSLVVIVVVYVIVMQAITYFKKPIVKIEPAPEVKTELYTGKIYHIFFHSLIVYPELAFSLNSGDRQGYQSYMVTRSEFLKILPLLYKNNFVLIDSKLLYKENTDGTISKKDLYIPVGKKPLILSLDDINYVRSQDGNGFATRLVLDSNGEVATEINTPEGKTLVTRDGDIIPILDDFIKAHPDFSYKGFKGIIALTGNQGALGYRTNNVTSPTYVEDVNMVKLIAKELKRTGWVFASHSYSHGLLFRDDSITLQGVKWDTEKWDAEVRPLVGDTNIFIGPFGQVFKPYDERRNYLVSKGFKELYGVGMDLYLDYSPQYLMMDRANIDGIRLVQTPHLLTEYFDPNEVVDQERFK